MLFFLKFVESFFQKLIIFWNFAAKIDQISYTKTFILGKNEIFDLKKPTIENDDNNTIQIERKRFDLRTKWFINSFSIE